MGCQINNVVLGGGRNKGISQNEIERVASLKNEKIDISDKKIKFQNFVEMSEI